MESVSLKVTYVSKIVKRWKKTPYVANFNYRVKT